MTNSKQEALLRAFTPEVEEAKPVVSKVAPKPKLVPKPGSPKGTKTGPRAQLKHFGGYVEDDCLEKIALLRVRLKLDNSELITFAIDALHKSHKAKRAFGDA